jgi:hypothetical protein
MMDALEQKEKEAKKKFEVKRQATFADLTGKQNVEFINKLNRDGVLNAEGGYVRSRDQQSTPNNSSGSGMEEPSPKRQRTSSTVDLTIGSSVTIKWKEEDAKTVTEDFLRKSLAAFGPIDLLLLKADKRVAVVQFGLPSAASLVAAKSWDLFTVSVPNNSNEPSTPTTTSTPSKSYSYSYSASGSAPSFSTPRSSSLSSFSPARTSSSSSAYRSPFASTSSPAPSSSSSSSIFATSSSTPVSASKSSVPPITPSSAPTDQSVMKHLASFEDKEMATLMRLRQASLRQKTMNNTSSDTAATTTTATETKIDSEKQTISA